MKLFLLPAIAVATTLLLGTVDFSKQASKEPVNISASKSLLLEPLQGTGPGNIRSIDFKSQDFCRVELKDFEFDIRFTVVSATVYFSGKNFPTVEKGFIVSNSLKPIKKMMDRCQPGSVVVFDDIKVKGPDNEVRSIEGVTYQLY
jgi:hypothetical protein